MILENAEIDQLERLLSYCDSYVESGRMFEKEEAIGYLAVHPHLLLPVGFSEARIFFGRHPRAKAIYANYNIERNDPGWYEVLLRHQHTGKWYILNWILDEYTHGQSTLQLMFSNEEGHRYLVPAHNHVAALRSHSAHRTISEHFFWFPPIFLREEHKVESVAAATVASQAIATLQAGSISLYDISWMEFEDIIAELLTNAGFKILRTRRTHDGGRDLIASGELFPGQQAKLAIEITHRRVVGVDKLSMALYRNRYYPLLMLVTSGRFSSGVVQEARKPENSMRLVLRDGSSVREWIDAYGLKLR
jgi:hypothetical protein